MLEARLSRSIWQIDSPTPRVDVPVTRHFCEVPDCDRQLLSTPSSLPS